MLPESDWFEGYYGPIEARIAELSRKYAGNPQAQALLTAETDEITLYRRCSSHYGYVFYLLKSKG
ncbi:MAG: hypothetical protein R3B54_07515 [Bdellovibrionota bacterium]